ncbi:9722_t:CDS:2 [Entrophospora sp. SA101]|nr:9722_t:CDS:2 [Entrophospora sp. SA101]
MKIYFSPSFIQEPVSLTTVEEKGQEYVLFRMVAGEYLTLENPNTLLLVPNDNSVFTRQIKEIVEKDETYHCVFVTSVENLKAKNLTFHGLLIKDTRSYVGVLEVEPFSLGIEGMPPITRLEFLFSTKENPQPGPSEPGIKKLTESDLYNNKLLTEGTGRNLTLKVKKFCFNDPTTLYFENSNGYAFGSLSEKKNQDDPVRNPIKTPLKDNSDNPPPKTSPINQKQKNSGTLKAVLIIGGIIAGLIQNWPTNIAEIALQYFPPANNNE